MTTLCNTPSITTWPSLTLRTDQIMALQSPWDLAKVAPQSPPTKAWVELEGRLNHQVSKFQMIPPNSAMMITRNMIERLMRGCQLRNPAAALAALD